MSRPLFVVDAFTARAFAGNPAAVCLLDAPRSDGWMQSVAAEMNLSETAYLLPEGDGFRLRWFTPAVEVDLCGHATLASAHVLWQERRARPGEAIRFHTRSGLLTVTPRGNGIAMDFPANPETAAAPPAGLCEALGVTPRHVGRTRFDYLIEVGSADEVRALKPD